MMDCFKYYNEIDVCRKDRQTLSVYFLEEMSLEKVSRT